MLSTSIPPRHLPVTAVLGPTNTGKTHLAVERMLGAAGGMIGLPLRLLAREVYDRVRLRAGDHAVALVTGEEKIIPAQPRYWVCTVEAMPPDLRVPFVAIDEVQLAGDLERGHIFTDRILHRRGTEGCPSSAMQGRERFRACPGARRSSLSPPIRFIRWRS
jgi:ATP-dependent RNA helicase SUPV3L1/SUV3